MSVLKFTTPDSGPGEVVAGDYACYITVGKFHREMTILVDISGKQRFFRVDSLSSGALD
jgi:hypothetical protein